MRRMRLLALTLALAATLAIPTLASAQQPTWQCARGAYVEYRAGELTRAQYQQRVLACRVR